MHAAEDEDSEELCISTEVITCSICFDNFTQPKTLPCGHSLCLSPCLENLCKENQKLCPLCRKPFNLPPSGRSEDLPTNFVVQHLLETAKPNKRVSFSSLEISEKKSWEYTESGNICSEHENENCDFFCITCLAVVCPKCLLSTHKIGRHNVVAAEDYSREKIDDLLQTLNKIQGIDVDSFKESGITMKFLKGVGSYYSKMPLFTKKLEQLKAQIKRVEKLCSSLVEDLCRSDFDRIKEVEEIPQMVRCLHKDHKEVAILYNSVCKDVRKLKTAGMVAAAAVGLSFGLPFIPL